MDLAKHPGQLFVIATLLPLASFLFLLLFAALRSALRSSKEGTTGRALYETLGGDLPPRWPAWVATAAIGLASVCCVVGFTWYLHDHHEIAEVERLLTENQTNRRELQKKLKEAEKAENVPQAETDALYDSIREESTKASNLRKNLRALERNWEGQIDWLKLGTRSEHASALRLGFKIDALSGVMFVMVTVIATLIHLFSIGYMSEEKERTVEDHQVHGEDGGHYKRRGRFGRFFMFLSLFCFSMLNLILADNFFQVFVSWELVGVCSYLLIGFYLERQTASNAANKAFITNRIGDAGFIIGLLILWTYCGTFNFDEIFAHVRGPVEAGHGKLMPETMTHHFVRVDGEPVERDGGKYYRTASDGSLVLLLGGHFHAPNEQGGEYEFEAEPHGEPMAAMPYWMLVVAGLGIFLGCVGKSAQFPLHVWLPDAMEGPTPVSALIHAATMVAAGVYLVGRCFPIFTAEALLVIAYTGAITLFVAATIAVVMTDIKKVLAYSTVSQLGYMMLALGIGGWAAGLFHLITHACFKALLFLGSGSVIYGCHHEQEMTKMGGLYPKMKITALTMLMGVLAIAGIPGFSGWYSKDAIVAQAMGYWMVNQTHILLFLLPLLTAGLTTFYMFRMWLMTFTGKPRDHHVYEHAHESPRIMTTPLIILAIFSVCVGWGWPFFSTHFPFIDAEASALEHTIHHAQPRSVQADFGVTKADVAAGMAFPGVPGKSAEQSERVMALKVHHLAGNLALAMVLIGIVFAFALYYYRVLDPEEARASLPAGHRFLSHKWYFDELYSVALVRPSLRIAQLCKNVDLKGIDWVIDNSARLTIKVAKFDGKFDNNVIDGLVNLTARVLDGIGGWFRRWQTGYLRSYVLFLVMAAIGIYVVLSFLMTTTG